MKSSHRRFALLTFATAVSAAALAVSAVAQNPDPQETVGQKFTFKANQLVDPYATPNRRIYIGSSSTPPGAGVHGMCGYWAAQSALRRVFGHGL